MGRQVTFLKETEKMMTIIRSDNKKGGGRNRTKGNVCRGGAKAWTLWGLWLFLK